MNNLVQITNIINENNIDTNNYTIDDLKNLLMKSEKISKLLDNYLKNSAKQSILRTINNNFIFDLINVYIDINDIKIIDDVYINTDDNLLYNELGKYKVLSKEEEINLFTKYKNKDSKVKDIIIKHNMKLVFSIAKMYASECNDIFDLFQEGILGLIKAIDHFDINKNVKFSTYATHWIRQSILRYISHNISNINISYNLREKIISYRKLKTQFNYNLSIEEVADKLNIPIKKAEAIIKLSETPKSLNDFVNEQKDELINFIEYENDITPEEATINNIFYKSLNDEIKFILNEDELNIIKLKYGYYDKSELSFKEVGQITNNTTANVRSTHDKALRKIRKNIPNLKSYKI